MKIEKSTVIRAVLLALVIINLILKAFGKPPIVCSEQTVECFVETTVEIAVIVSGFWYNNSFTENAKKADEFLKKLNDRKKEG